jgi:hypothetical protein
MRYLNFTSRKFQIEPDEHSEVYGNQLRAWLHAKLNAHGILVLHEQSKNAGWGYFMFTPFDKGKLWIVVSHDYDPDIDAKIAKNEIDRIVWCISVDPECSLWTALFDRKTVTSAAAKIYRTLDHILSDPDLTRQKDTHAGGWPRF